MLCLPDTSGVLRALLGIGAGSWGGNGLNAEWTPVLSLADEAGQPGLLYWYLKVSMQTSTQAAGT